jgi:hypothetical protein
MYACDKLRYFGAERAPLLFGLRKRGIRRRLLGFRGLFEARAPSRRCRKGEVCSPARYGSAGQSYFDGRPRTWDSLSDSFSDGSRTEAQSQTDPAKISAA